MLVMKMYPPCTSRGAAWRESIDDRIAKAIDSFTGASGYRYLVLLCAKTRQVRLVGDSQETALIARFSYQLAVSL